MHDLMDAHMHNQSQRVPAHTLDELNRYVNERAMPGDFLTALLSNNLIEAFARADDLNIKNMYAIVVYCYNQIPTGCWGNEEAVKQWLERDEQC